MFFISKRRKKFKKGVFVRINEKIIKKELRVIDEDGTQLGIINKEEALSKAYEKGLDLVEVSPNADPPVCKIMDYGKYVYEKKKKDKISRRKQKLFQLKEIRLTPMTNMHDVEHKANHTIKFLQKGNKVKIEMFFKGREIVHPDLGEKLMYDFFNMVSEYADMESPPVMEGYMMMMVVCPKKKVH